jgi:hypothetical protein
VDEILTAEETKKLRDLHKTNVCRFYCGVGGVRRVRGFCVVNYRDEFWCDGFGDFLEGKLKNLLKHRKATLV